MSWTMYSLDGHRKYLTQSETRRFLEEARRTDLETYAFCALIAMTGCRISEALALNVDNLDFESKNIVFECLKKRRRHVFRSIPVPTDVLKTLRSLIRTHRLRPGERLWTWSRMTGYRRVREIMDTIGVEGPQASPKGLRHGFGVSAIQAGVPLNMVQRWLGHADMKTTAIYTSAIGPEERDIASRMWGRSFQLYEKPGPDAERGRPARILKSVRKQLFSVDPGSVAEPAPKRTNRQVRAPRSEPLAAAAG
jgi:integrase